MRMVGSCGRFDYQNAVALPIIPIIYMQKSCLIDFFKKNLVKSINYQYREWVKKDNYRVRIVFFRFSGHYSVFISYINMLVVWTLSVFTENRIGKWVLGG